MKKHLLLSVAAATALSFGASTLTAQAATVQPSTIKVQNIQQVKHMNQEELQAYLQSMGINSKVMWNQVQFKQGGCSIPNQNPNGNDSTGNVVVTPEPSQPAEEQPAEEQPADNNEVTPPAAQNPSDNNNNNNNNETQKPADKPAEETKSLSEFEQRVVDLTNAERAKQGLPALKVDTELSKVARIKSEDMQKNNYFDHNSPTYGSPFDMMKKFGISYTSAGENIAQGQRTPEEVVQAWMNSAGHRANILNSSYTHIGVGYVENGNYWTQQFIAK